MKKKERKKSSRIFASYFVCGHDGCFCRAGAASPSIRSAMHCFRFASWEREANERRGAAAATTGRSLSARSNSSSTDLCGSCGVAGISHEVHETHMSRTVEETNSHKPARLICGKRCGFVAVRQLNYVATKSFVGFAAANVSPAYTRTLHNHTRDS